MGEFLHLALAWGWAKHLGKEASSLFYILSDRTHYILLIHHFTWVNEVQLILCSLTYYILLSLWLLINAQSIWRKLSATPRYSDLLRRQFSLLLSDKLQLLKLFTLTVWNTFEVYSPRLWSVHKLSMFFSPVLQRAGSRRGLVWSTGCLFSSLCLFPFKFLLLLYCTVPISYYSYFHV